MTDVVAITERLLDEAGLGPGMRVLDVGCGRGDVSVMAARRVGATGLVVGIDRDPLALEAARANAEALRPGAIRFVDGDLRSPPRIEGGFDAVIGRRVLMYQPDPAGSMAALAAVLRPGGVVAFQEHDGSMPPGRLAPLALHEKVRGWIWDTVIREGGDPAIGFRLPAIMAEAGLTVEDVRAEAVVQTPDWSHNTGAIVRAMLPRIVGLGVATAVEIDPDTLDGRLAAERRDACAVFVGEMVFCVRARKSAGPAREVDVRADEAPSDPRAAPRVRATAGA